MTKGSRNSVKIIADFNIHVGQVRGHEISSYWFPSDLNLLLLRLIIFSIDITPT